MKTLFATIQLLAMLLWTAEAGSSVQSTTFPRIKLTPTNEVDPFKGVAFASGKVDHQTQSGPLLCECPRCQRASQIEEPRDSRAAPSGIQDHGRPSEEVSRLWERRASGVATIKFESAGTVICVDATIQGFDPVLGHLHNAQSGVNGPVVVNFSSTKVAPGRFLGCITVANPPVAGQPSVQTVLDILDDPSDYYFNFHAGAPQTPDFNVAIRGQLDEI
ncbi:hypothetical protein MHU86_12968 [Fragilaria crotonensis]|nr:hypothetical protein MHU86_12968 [Fragilaria crotonensis]